MVTWSIFSSSIISSIMVIPSVIYPSLIIEPIVVASRIITWSIFLLGAILSIVPFILKIVAFTVHIFFLLPKFWGGGFLAFDGPPFPFFFFLSWAIYATVSPYSFIWILPLPIILDSSWVSFPTISSNEGRRFVFLIVVMNVSQIGGRPLRVMTTSSLSSTTSSTLSNWSLIIEFLIM